jgi:pimeloyl-ACP methyl ester carboxylesterase
MRPRAITVAAILAVTLGVWSPPGEPRSALAQDVSRFTKTVEANGLAFPVIDYGEGSPVVLLHGFPDDRHVWRHQMPVLGSAGLRVIAPDLRGFGDAPRPSDPGSYGLGLAAKDVIGILDTLRVGEAQLVGHDWGAALGWYLAAQHPDRFRRFVALSVGAPGAAPTAEQGEKSSYMALFRQAGIAEAELQRDDWKLFREWLRSAPDSERYITSLSRPGALTAALNWYRASNAGPGTPTAGAGKTVVCPVLGVWSDGDAYLAEDQMRTSGERITGPFEYERITGASHWMMLDKPNELNRLLLRFLEREI